MKKNKPAKKGFAPFKENKSSARYKDNRSPLQTDRPRRDEEEGGKKPRAARGQSGNDTPRKAGGKPAKHGHGGFDADYKREGTASARRGPAGEKPAKRTRGGFGETGDAFDESTAKRGRGKSGAAPHSDDSAFHSAGPRKAAPRGKDARTTPSGFNRQHFFDRVNDRFAEKQARKTGGRKYDRDEEDYAGKGKRQEREPVKGEMPLNKYIAHTGLCSRRKAVDFVKEGKVTVNGELVTEPAFRVTAKDVVKISNKRVNIQKNLVYILLNKPKGYITTTNDPEGRQTVMELVRDAADERVYPVGRLDRNTSGLLLLTNDGELAQKLAHPKHNIKKIYHVGLDKPLTKADFEQILQGVTLEDGLAQVDALGYVEPNDKTQLGIEIHSGKNRIVRRIFEHLGYQVEKLDRVMYAGLTKKNINRGKWRFLTEKEVILLKHFK